MIPADVCYSGIHLPSFHSIYILHSVIGSSGNRVVLQLFRWMQMVSHALWPPSWILSSRSNELQLITWNLVECMDFEQTTVVRVPSSIMHTHVCLTHFAYALKALWPFFIVFEVEYDEDERLKIYTHNMDSISILNGCI